jgi:hypothetical protein
MLYKRKRETQQQFVARITHEAIAAGANTGEQVVSFAADQVGFIPVLDYFNAALLEAHQQAKKGEQPK